jgi:hypothetical protein
MRTKARPTINEIPKATGVSRATVDRFLHRRLGLTLAQGTLSMGLSFNWNRPMLKHCCRLQGEWAPKRRFGLIIQAVRAFSRSLIAMLKAHRNGDPSQLENHSCESETRLCRI